MLSSSLISLVVRRTNALLMNPRAALRSGRQHPIPHRSERSRRRSGSTVGLETSVPRLTQPLPRFGGAPRVRREVPAAVCHLRFFFGEQQKDLLCRSRARPQSEISDDFVSCGGGGDLVLASFSFGFFEIAVRSDNRWNNLPVGWHVFLNTADPACKIH